MKPIEQNNLGAALWMIGAVISFSAMAVAGREMASQLDTFEIMMYRSAIGVIVVIILARFFGTVPEITRDRFGMHFIRNLAHFTGQNLWFFAVTLIPFAQLFAFEFSVPIWVALAAPFLLGEKLTRLRGFAICAGFFGILIVTRPWLEAIGPGIIAGALCALAFAATSICTKLLTRDQSITCIMFWLTALQLCFGIICAGYDGDIALPSGVNIGWVLVVAVGGLVAHFCITKALTMAPATIVTPIDFARLPIIALIGAIFYAEALDVWVIIGAVVIFSANYVNIWAENRNKRVAV